MKTRIILFILTFIMYGFISRALLQPSTVLIKNVATVSTVNGGNSEYLTQQAINHATSYGWWSLGALVIIVIFWYGPVSLLLSQNKS